MRQCVRTGRYVLTTHAHAELEADGLTVFDLEECILSGRIISRQRDLVTFEWKYVVRGLTTEAKDANVVAKFGPTKVLVVVTVFLE